MANIEMDKLAPKIIDAVQNFLNAGFEHCENSGFRQKLPRLDFAPLEKIAGIEIGLEKPMFTLAHSKPESLIGRRYTAAGIHVVGKTVAVVFDTADKKEEYCVRFQLADMEKGAPVVDRYSVDGGMMDGLVRALAPKHG